MKKVLLLVLMAIFLTSCGASKRSSVITTKKEAAKRENLRKETTQNSSLKKVEKVANLAKSFEGTPYQYGGTTSKGMDCSGLIYTCYLQEEVELPRTSKAMSQYGKKIKEKDMDVGDLLFFQTNKSSKKINHVGLVVEKDRDQVYFIHSTSSRGVIISSLSNSFWNSCFVMVRRII